MTGTPLSGGCLCGDVRFEAGTPDVLGYCHCAICRKWTGALFNTSLLVPRSRFRYVQGEEGVARFSRKGSDRGHCRICGSSVPGGPLDGDWIGIPAGLLDTDPGLRPAGHVFVRSKVPWLELDDGLPRFETWVPGREPDWARRDARADLGPLVDWKRAEARPRGSCLCGTVRYELDPEPERFVRCHCSRCRRATGSAYAANLYFEPSRFRWTAGRESMARYDLPSARSFSNEFCTLCGSTMPHATRSGREMVVPTGTLDDDPGVRIDGDLFPEDAPTWI